MSVVSELGFKMKSWGLEQSFFLLAEGGLGGDQFILGWSRGRSIIILGWSRGRSIIILGWSRGRSLSSLVGLEGDQLSSLVGLVGDQLSVSHLASLVSQGNHVA
jgi:hypothetical protein